MGSLLMYRGLPGGPTEIKLADEIPRHCLCGKCGMLTLSMYQDPKDHMFCETCLKEQSMEERSSIYCPYERKEIGIEEMFQARDLVMILRDQYVDCPNQPDCKEKLPLEHLHDHYVTCKPRVQCSRCRESIETKQWKNHTCTSVIQDGGHQEKEEPSVFTSREPRERKQSAMQKLRSALAASTAPYREALGWTTEASQPDRQAASAKRGTAAPIQDIGSENCGPAATQECQYCHRRVKETNMQRHVQNCTRAPRPCVYCDEPFLPENMASHLEVCGSNPDNVAESKSAAAASGATSETPDTDCTGPAGFHTDSGTNLEDLPMWLQYLASGNWLSAYVAMEESLRTSSLQDTDRYALCAPAFVHLEQRACVEDFLAEPCPVQPLDCLMAALFVRAYLPRDVLSRREPVTWERALEYLPHFLASRLSEGALAYLCAYPVFLNENGSQCNIECASAASAQPCLHPEPRSTSEENPSRTSCEAHGGTKPVPGTSNASLEEKAAQSPASDCRCSGRARPRGPRCTKCSHRSRATWFYRRRASAIAPRPRHSCAARAGRVTRRVAGMVLRRRRVLGQARRFRKHAKVSSYEVVLVPLRLEQYRRYPYVTSPDARLRVCTHGCLQEKQIHARWS